MKVDNLKLYFGEDILVNEEAGIYVRQPLVKEVVAMGEDNFNKLTLPYTITSDAVFNGMENEEELIKKYHIFELFFMRREDGKTILDDALFDGINAMDIFTDSLRYFIGATDIRVLEYKKKLVVDNKYLIDKDEYMNLRKVIQKVICKEDLEVEKPPKNMSKKKLEIWNKLQKGRARKALREALYFQDVSNFISFGGNSFIPKREIKDMTVYDFRNAYKSIMGKDAYNTGLQYKLSQKFDVKGEIKHWTESLRIGK